MLLSKRQVCEVDQINAPKADNSARDVIPDSITLWETLSSCFEQVNYYKPVVLLTEYHRVLASFRIFTSYQM